MRLKYLLIFFFSLLYSSDPTFCQTVIKAADFGVKPNSNENAAPGLRKAIEVCKASGNAILVLPGGRIDVWPEGAEQRELYISNCTEDDTLSKVKNIAFSFENCKNVTLDGRNTLVMLHGKMLSFALLNSVNIRIRNISFDYERPTMSELTIRSVSDTVIETQIHPDSKYAIEGRRINFYGENWKMQSYHAILFDPARQMMRYSDFKPFLTAKAVENNPLSVRFEGNFTNTGFRAGEVLTVRDPYRDNCGGLISRSKNIELENVKMHYMHGLGIVSQFSENISFWKVVVAPRENSGRIISSFADCFHFSGCKGLVKIDNCLTSGSHDDAVNVHGTHLKMTALDETKKIRVRFMHHQTYGFEAFFEGDSIAFINPQTLLPLGKAIVKSARLINKREMEIEVAGTMPSAVQPGLSIENLSWTPEVVIRNSRFERTNTRGMLITTPRKVLIENNVFYHTGMFPILIANDASSWFESGAVRDVTIRNNVFEGCGYNSKSGAIKIAPENHELVPGNTVHRNIRIIGNTFKMISNGLLEARSVDNLVFSKNKIRNVSLQAENMKLVVDLTACKNVVIGKNHFNRSASPVINTVKMSKADLETNLAVNMLNRKLINE
ncbi:right-handed parallel beta-helix repeat-containing protein [Flavihumibacter sp. R14]|nr:right-handed parallel beta-helix repeat-containing protein [Flavihumibacter soli]